MIKEETTEVDPFSELGILQVSESNAEAKQDDEVLRPEGVSSPADTTSEGEEKDDDEGEPDLYDDEGILVNDRNDEVLDSVDIESYAGPSSSRGVVKHNPPEQSSSEISPALAAQILMYGIQLGQSPYFHQMAAVGAMGPRVPQGIPGVAGFQCGSNSRRPAGLQDVFVDEQQVGKKETGIVEKLLHNFGFVQCCDRNERLFFHFSAYIGDIHQLKNGDEVQFQETSDRRTGKPIAIKVSKMVAASSERWSKRRYIGEVTYAPKHNAILKPGSGPQTEFGRLCFERKGEKYSLSFVPTDVRGDTTYLKQGDRVSFRIATDDRTDSMKARDVCLEESVPSPRLQGVVCSMKDNFGFIKQVEGTADVFFHFSEYMGGQISELKIGEAVEFEIHTRNGKAVATSIYPLEMGEVFSQFGCEARQEIVRKSYLTPIAPQQQQREQEKQQQQPSKVKLNPDTDPQKISEAPILSAATFGDDTIALLTEQITTGNQNDTKVALQRQMMRIQEMISSAQLQNPLIANLQSNLTQSDWLKLQSVGQMSAIDVVGQMAHFSSHQQQSSASNKVPRPEPNDRYHYTAPKRPRKSDQLEEGGKKLPRTSSWIKQESDQITKDRRFTRSRSRERSGLRHGQGDHSRKRSISPFSRKHDYTNRKHRQNISNRSLKRRSADSRERSSSRQLRRKTPHSSTKD